MDATHNTNKTEDENMTTEWKTHYMVEGEDMLVGAEYLCSSDEWTPEAEIYTLGEFLEMCVACFGEAPTLVEDVFGNYCDEVGDIVLELL